MATVHFWGIWVACLTFPCTLLQPTNQPTDWPTNQQINHPTCTLHELYSRHNISLSVNEAWLNEFISAAEWDWELPSNPLNRDYCHVRPQFQMKHTFIIRLLQLCSKFYFWVPKWKVNIWKRTEAQLLKLKHKEREENINIWSRKSAHASPNSYNLKKNQFSLVLDRS